MTNGRGAAMASFMTKKKKYKFQVEVCLEELLEVPFVSAVLFAKLRLLDGGNFQDHSQRAEVRDHTVKWNGKYSFPCKMLANASTGVLERCVLRVSIRKECKGGKSFNKLGFVDLNLAEFAGSGETCKKALLEGYDTRHRQDNSMLKISIKMNMLAGDILFKVPSPSLKPKPVPTEDAVITEPRTMDEFSSGSLAGSIASASSGFGSLPKKRPALLSSELVRGNTLTENNVPVTDGYDMQSLEIEEVACEPGHSRNSSNTSQMSKASGYSSIQSHSRQSSSGDSGHIRELHMSKRGNTINILSTFPEDANTPINNNHIKSGSQTPDDKFSTPRGCLSPMINENNYLNYSNIYYTPKEIHSITDEYHTPETPFTKSNNIFCRNFSDELTQRRVAITKLERNSLDNSRSDRMNEGVLRSKSDFEIPRRAPELIKQNSFFNNFAFLTPMTRRRAHNMSNNNTHSTPSRSSVTSASFKVSPIQKIRNSRTTSLNSLKSSAAVQDGYLLGGQPIPRGLPHRKLLEGTSGGKLATVATSPDESTTISSTNTNVVSLSSSDCAQTPTIRRPSVTQNPSSSSLVLSETGSLDRAKAALERRKKNQSQEPDTAPATGRVEGTRVNPDHLIDEIIKNTNLDQADDSAESSGLQLFIAKDGTAALGSHEVKSQMSTGVFKQVVMEDNR